MAEIMLLDNPRPKKKSRRSRKMPAKLLAYFKAKRNAPSKRKKKVAAKRKRVAMPGGKKHRPVFYGSEIKLGVRSPFKRLNSPKGKGTMKRKKHSRRRYRHNPPLGGIMRSATSGLKTAAMGAVAIAANKFIANQIARMTNIQTGNKQLVELGTALIVLPFAARAVKMPALAAAANVAAASAIYDAGKKYLPASVASQLGDYGFPTNLPAVDGGMSGLAATDTEGFIVDPGVTNIPGAVW